MARNRTTRRSQASQRTLLAAGVAILAVAAIAGWLLYDLNRQTSPAPHAASASPTSSSPALPIATASPVPAGPATPTTAPTATPTARPSPTPTATPAATPTPAPTVVIGSFGELPAPNLPQPDPALSRLQLSYKLNVDLNQVPKTAPVYALIPRTWSAEQVASIAQKLGIMGAVQPQGENAFSVQDNAQLLTVSGSTIQYQRLQRIETPAATPRATPAATATSGANTPTGQISDAQAIAVARYWLTQYFGDLPNLGQGQVIGRVADEGLTLVLITPSSPPVLSAIPGAQIAVAPDGSIQQARVFWPARFEPSTYSLRPAETLWNDVQAGRGYIALDPSLLPSGSGQLTGQVTITQVQIVYTDAGDASRRYLTPLAEFVGQAQIEGLNKPIPVQIAVPAVAAQTLPRG
ncbi:MAG: hypothetical protein IRY86_00885 [Thermorudis peleae]|nr:hypothetical protein [Thermorudis peleae]